MGHRFAAQRPMAPHRAMVELYEQKGARRYYVEADEGLPLSVFTLDSSFMIPSGAVITSIQTPTRRRDYAVASQFYTKAGIPICIWVKGGHFEGGDFVVLKPSVALLGWSGDRPTKEDADQIIDWLREKDWELLVTPIPLQDVRMDAFVVLFK